MIPLVSGPMEEEEIKSPPFDKLRAGFLVKDARNGAPGRLRAVHCLPNYRVSEI